ncbi:nuclear envelope pore membrane protein POM 121 [Arvicanthis niloticus]|uniref:nuclear envelope pore membrane protein POM 121 n=1 Tax=Arvicanthis niloticus TaxID=61156 RepID=UPI00148642D1|nr:nuclear envelope pore membrane protein POM 121 [Arvicanthis niloticus]
MSPAAAAADGGERRRPPLGVREGRGRARGCGGPAGAAALGLALLGLALYLVPAAAALAWLAVGSSAAWWGLSREPRGPRGLSSFVRDSRRHPRPALTASPPPVKSPVNGSLCEPRSPLGGPDPAELLLMGSYLGKPGPPEPALPQDPRDRPGRRPPSRSPPAAAAQRVHHVYPALPTPLLRPSRRPPHRDCGPLSSRFVITPRRRYPIQQAQYSLLGALPTVCWNGGHKKAVLSARNSRMVCSPVTVRIAPPDSKLFPSPMPEQILDTTLSSTSSNAPDPCAKETVLNALKEKKKRTAAEEDQLHLEGQENKRRRHDSSGSGHSAFEPLVANGVPAAFVPKPGSLKRSLASQSSDDHLNKRSRTSSVSSLTSICTGGIPSSSRNAITSSYSSTRGISQLWKRSGPTSSPFSSPASSRSQTPERPAKKTREEEPCQQSSSSAPLVTDKESPGEKVTDTATGKQQSLWTSPPTPGSSGQRKRKIQLLPSRRGDQLTLPPPPELGYSITAEDLDMERKASLQWFNKVLEDKPDDASTSAADNPPATSPPFTFTLPTVGPAAPSASLPAPSSNPLLESLKKMQESPAPSSSEPAEAATIAAPSPPKTPSLLAPLVSPLTGPLASTSSDSKPTATFLGLASASSTTPFTDTKSPGVSQAEQSVSTPVSTAPSPTPKPSMLFGMLSPPASSSSSLATPGPACASPMFKPIFPATPKSESDSPLPASSSASTAASSSTALPTTASTTAPTFKPIFDRLEAFTAMPLSTPFSLKQTTAPATTTATSAPLFTGLGTATSTVASGTTASASKPVFGFGVTTAASTASSTMTSTSQTLLFGGAPAVTTSSSAPALTSIFQFGKPLAPAASAASASFSQPLASSAQTAASNSSGFSGFGSTLTTSTSAPATTSQPTLTFSSTVTPTFNIPFSSGAKPALPAYPGANPQPTFGATDGATKPAPAPSFGSSFTFGNSVASAPSAAPAPAPATFGSAVQPAFGGLKAAASTFGTPASTQPAFGSTTPVFSFGSATTSGFGAAVATTQTTNSGSSSSLFGSSTPSPFTFGGSAAPAASGAFGLTATPGTSSSSGTFSFGSGQSGTTGTTTSFGGSLSQNTLGAPSQSSPFAFSVGSTPESKPVFGGTSTPTFGQSAPAPGVGTAGSSLSFGASSTPAQGFVGVGPFGSAAPSFSIGAGSKTPGARQRLQARRQHTRKK